MYTNPTYDDLDVASIQSEKANLVDATITNLIVTGSITYPDSSGNTDSSGFVVQSLDVSGNCIIGGELTCKGNVVLGDQTTSEGTTRSYKLNGCHLAQNYYLNRRNKN
jgi:hypothetical protein